MFSCLKLNTLKIVLFLKNKMKLIIIQSFFINLLILRHLIVKLTNQTFSNASFYHILPYFL